MSRGIYGIWCIPDPGVYVGQTNNLHGRWYVHRQQLQGGRHPNSLLATAWDKYGPDNFRFVEIYQDIPEKHLLAYEHEMMRGLLEKDVRLYNINGIIGAKRWLQAAPNWLVPAEERRREQIRKRVQEEVYDPHDSSLWRPIEIPSHRRVSAEDVAAHAANIKKWENRTGQVWTTASGLTLASLYGYPSL